MVATRLLALYINTSLHLRAGASTSERHFGARTYLHSLLGTCMFSFSEAVGLLARVVGGLTGWDS
jgi:hypothetical protein